MFCAPQRLPGLYRKPRGRRQETRGSLLQAVGAEHGRLAGSFAEMAETRTLLAEETSESQRPKVLRDLLTTILEKFESPKKLGVLNERNDQGLVPGVGNIIPTIDPAVPNLPELQESGS